MRACRVGILHAAWGLEQAGPAREPARACQLCASCTRVFAQICTARGSRFMMKICALGTMGRLCSMLDNHCICLRK